MTTREALAIANGRLTEARKALSNVREKIAYALIQPQMRQDFAQVAEALYACTQLNLSEIEADDAYDEDA